MFFLQVLAANTSGFLDNDKKTDGFATEKYRSNIDLSLLKMWSFD